MKDECGYEQLTQTFPCCDEKCEKCPFTIAEIDRQYGEAIKDALSDLTATVAKIATTTMTQ